jgi:hypothetical protein
MATATTTAPERRPPKMVYGEVLSFAYETFCSNKVRFALTALGMVIGTASLILVVTIGMTGKQYEGCNGGGAGDRRGFSRGSSGRTHSRGRRQGT